MRWTIPILATCMTATTIAFAADALGTPAQREIVEAQRRLEERPSDDRAYVALAMALARRAREFLETVIAGLHA